MFTIGNFIKFLIVLFLSVSSGYIPIIGDIGKILGGGIGESTIAIFVRFVFFWFVISKLLQFLSFTFGGGLGRYSTTKIYRRIQRYTFILITSLPFWVIATLLFSATPLAEHSETYLREASRIKQERRQLAEIERQQRIVKAKERRAIEQNEWEHNRSLIIARAKEERQERIKAKIASLKNEIIEAYKPQRDVLKEEQSALLKEPSERLSPYRDKDFNTSNLIAGTEQIIGRMVRELNVKIDKRTKKTFFESFLNPIFFLEHFYTDKCIDAFIKSSSKGLFVNRNDNKYCVLYLLLVINVARDSNTPLAAPIEQHPDNIKFGNDLLYAINIRDDFLDFSKRVQDLQAKEKAELDAVQYTEPPVNEDSLSLIAKFGTYPPSVREDSFALAIDNSPIVAKDPYFERISPTFEKHFWWLFLIALLFWWSKLDDLRGLISKIYSRFARVILVEGLFGRGGSARFANMFEEWGSLYKKDTLYVGCSLSNPKSEIGLSGESHMLTVAGSRSGKGATAIIPNLLLWEGSAVVIDPKGTNAHVTAEARRRMGHDVHLIDPFGIVTKQSDRFDPLDGISADDPLVRERIASIADALVVPDENAREKHWDEGAKTILKGLITQLVSSEVENKCLFQVRDLINQLPEDQDELWDVMSKNYTAGGGARDAAMRYIRGSHTNEILGLMSNADKHTEWLSSPIMREVTSDPTFKISDIKKKPTTIYLIIPPRELERQNRLLRLFINLTIDAMEIGGKSDIPVLMIMDEFLALGKMSEIPDAFATMASYNLTMWPFVQDLGRMQELYGEGFNSFITNSRALQAFAVSDKKTLDFISETIGNRPMGNPSNIISKNDIVPLRSPNDIKLDVSAEEGRQYILRTGQSPMTLEKVPYFKKGNRFAGQYDPDPDFA